MRHMELPLSVLGVLGGGGDNERTFCDGNGGGGTAKRCAGRGNVGASEGMN